MTTAGRIAAVVCSVAGVKLCVASLHCSKSPSTAPLLAALQEVLEDVAGVDKFVIGLDSNTPSSDMDYFQDRLRALGVDFGDDPDAEQVTVAKTRTVFQTQVLKSGETDVSHLVRHVI